MAERGMGLKPTEFLDFMQGIITKDQRPSPFKEGRPVFNWYYAFMARNAGIIKPRKEKPLEMCRAKLEKSQTDKWYTDFRNFLVKKDLINHPKRIWNADETGFSMGSTASIVIVPTRNNNMKTVPHISGGHSKQRFTVMYCGSAAGDMMPPFHIFPEPKPKGYNPLTGGLEGSEVAYTKKGWMDANTFKMFLAHFDKHIGQERPVVLLIDSVSSHVDMTVFQDAKSKGIELFRLVPNATHLMQPLDKGVFGPLKTRWHQVVRKHTRENPGSPIGKETFAEKLKEAFLLFYKPLTVINSFKASGIYPVDSSVITREIVKPGLTFAAEESSEKGSDEGVTKTIPDENLQDLETSYASGALDALKSVLDTPTKERYQRRIDEGYDINGMSPCFDAFRKLLDKTKPSMSAKCPSSSTISYVQVSSGLELLAEAAMYNISPDRPVSRAVEDALVLPRCELPKPKRKTLLSTLPNNLTSSECIRTMALRELETIKTFAEREKKAKLQWVNRRTQHIISKKQQKKGKNEAKKQQKKAKNIKISCASKRKEHIQGQSVNDGEEDIICMGCHMSWGEDLEMNDGNSVWVQCDTCNNWIHADCCTAIDNCDEVFQCPECL